MNKFLIWVVLLCGFAASAQNDTIYLKNKEIITGEIKTLNKGVLTVETGYSDSDFKIEYDKVTRLSVQRKCLVILTEGRRRFGYLNTETLGLASITLEDGTVEVFRLEEITSLQEINSRFWSRFKGSIDLGLNITKANNNVQFTIGGNINYIDQRWLFQANINVLSQQQDDTEKIERTDASFELIRVLPRRWYLLADVSYLSNTEQALDGRISPTLGLGKFLISTNKLYLGLSIGLLYNIENYVDPSLNKTSAEGNIGLSFNMFDFKDIFLETTANFYPSLSESGRVRLDYNLNLKYDLPYDFYIKLGYTLNYDNQPPAGSSTVDYILSSGIGWKFD